MKRIWIGFIVVLGLLPVEAQTVKEVFTSLAEPALLPLSTNRRLDLIDLYVEGQKAVVSNSFGDEVALTSLTDDYLCIRSGISNMEIFLLTLINESKLIGFIQTVCAPGCDSRIEFYGFNGKKLDTDAFISIAGKPAFIADEAGLPVSDILLTEFHYDAQNQSLTQTYNTPAYLSPEEQKKPEKTKEYKWNGLRFE